MLHQDLMKLVGIHLQPLTKTSATLHPSADNISFPQILHFAISYPLFESDLYGCKSFSVICISL